MPSMPTDLQAALYCEPLPEQYVRCTLCPHDCKIAPDGRGACGVRINHEGQLFTRVRNRMVSAEIDPIEKKPLFHFLPGSTEHSIATVGCNLRCRFCQNWVISQWPKRRKLVNRGEDTSSAVREHPASEWCAETEPPEACWGIGTQVVPSELVAEAKRTGCRSIAYTYTEPTIFFELALSTARLASAAGLDNIFVTNGFISRDPLREIGPYLGAANIDLKSFRDRCYKRLCGARLEPVLAAIREYKKLGVWVELTTVLIPGLNDDEGELRDIAHFIRFELGEDAPWHISRFFPAYKDGTLAGTPASFPAAGEGDRAGGGPARCVSWKCADGRRSREYYLPRLWNGRSPSMETHGGGKPDSSWPLPGLQSVH